MHDDLRVKQSVLGENTREVYLQIRPFLLLSSPPNIVNQKSYQQELEDLYNWVQSDKSEAGKKHRIFKINAAGCAEGTTRLPEK